MKYWLYLASKLLLSVGVVLALEVALCALYSPLPKPRPGYPPVESPFPQDMAFTFLVVATWLVGAALFYLSFWDQRRRCRTCLRKLIMPVRRGSWGNMVVFGRPQTEWICAFGHGTLNTEDLQITGRQFPEWQPHDDDIWKELESVEQAQR